MRYRHGVMSVPCDSMPREALRAVRDRPKTPRGALRATFSRRTQCLTRHPRGGGRPSACRHAARGIPRDARGARIAPRDEAVARGALRATRPWREERCVRCARIGDTWGDARNLSFSENHPRECPPEAANRPPMHENAAFPRPSAPRALEKLQNAASRRSGRRFRARFPAGFRKS